MTQPQVGQGDWQNRSKLKMAELERQIQEIEDLPPAKSLEEKATRHRLIAQILRSIQTIQDDL